MTRPDKNPPALVITAEEVAEATAPFVIAYAGTTYQLRNPNALSVDDAVAVGKTSEDSMLDALAMVADDDKTAAWLRSMPNVFLAKVFKAWDEQFGVDSGESDGSENSSEPPTSE